jgi:uncharacterized membrane protein YfcA
MPADYFIACGLIGVLSFLAAVVQGAVTFGDALVFQVLWRVLAFFIPGVLHAAPLGGNDLLQATLLLSVRSPFTQAWFSYASRAQLAPRPVALAFPFMLVSMAVGTFVLRDYYAAPWLPTALGAALIGCAVAIGLLMVYRERQNARRRAHDALLAAGPSTIDRAALFVWGPTQKAALCVAAVGAGITGGVANIGGPPFMVMSLVLDLPNDVVRGVAPPLQALVFAARFVYFLAIGAYDSRAWLAYASIVVCGMGGQFLGLRLRGSVRHAHSNFIILWFILLGGLLLGDVPEAVALGAFGVGVVAVLLFPVVYPAPPPPTEDPAHTAATEMDRLLAPSQPLV